MNTVAAYTQKRMTKPKIKEGRVEFRPTPRSLFIIQKLLDRYGSKTNVMERALELLAYAEKLEVPDIRAPSGASLTSEAKAAYETAEDKG